MIFHGDIGAGVSTGRNMVAVGGNRDFIRLTGGFNWRIMELPEILDGGALVSTM
jgi:hypothetical protein